MIRHRYLRATLLLLFLALHVPGYGLHAVVGIKHDAQTIADPVCCVICEAYPKLDSEREASPQHSAEHSSCCVCKLLATLATMAPGWRLDASVITVPTKPINRITPCVVSKTSKLARGPPA